MKLGGIVMEYGFHSEFDLEKHKIKFLGYLEVIIMEDGEIVYAIPSHQEKLISIACSKQNITREQLNDKCPREYYFDFMTWLCMETGCISVWNDFYYGDANPQQVESLIMLYKERVYLGPIPE